MTNLREIEAAIVQIDGEADTGHTITRLIAVRKKADEVTAAFQRVCAIMIVDERLRIKVKVSPLVAGKKG